MNYLKRFMNKNKKYHCGLLVIAVIAFFSLTPVSASDNFVKISLPKGVSIELPKDWVVLSENLRIALDTVADSGLDLAGIEHENSDIPFTANYYKNNKIVGIVQTRYYPNIDLTQNDSRQATPQDMNEMNTILKERTVKSMTAVDEVSGLTWTKKTTINGITAFVTEYHRKTGEFRVHLIRVFAGKRTFTLTAAYLEEELFPLEPNINRIINSLKLSGIIEEDLDISVAGNKDASTLSGISETPREKNINMKFHSKWEALLVLIIMYILSAGVIFGDLRAEDLDRRPLWVNNSSGVTIFLFYLLWPLWILAYSSSLLYGSWRLRWEKLYKLLRWLVGISYVGMAVAMAIGITAAVTRWFGDIGWIRIPVFFLGLYLLYIILRIFRPKKKEFDQIF